MQGATLIRPLRNIGIVALLALVAPTRANEGEPVESVHIECGELSVTFRDNSRSPQVLSGVDSLFNTTHAAEDCADEYEQWAAALSAERAQLATSRVEQLKHLGATVFQQGDEVIEVNASRIVEFAP